MSGGLAEEVDEKVLHAAFIPFGDIIDIQIPLDYETGKIRTVLSTINNKPCSSTEMKVFALSCVLHFQRSTEGLHSSNLSWQR